MISLDEQIKLSVIDQLKWDSRVDISDIDVCGLRRNRQTEGQRPLSSYA